MNAALATIALTLTACVGPVTNIDACIDAESLARHHSAARAGPRLTFASGTTLKITAGRQQPLYAPGEPTYSARAPSTEFQIAAEATFPIWKRSP